MGSDHFSSSTLQTVIAWIIAAPILFIILEQAFFFLRPCEGLRRWLSIWIGICFLFLSPLRYLYFLLLLSAVYTFQHIGALLSHIFGLALLGPFILGLFWICGFILPLVLVLWISGIGGESTLRNRVAAAILAPIIALAGTVVFALLQPLAALATDNLTADDVIRATNGPAYYAFCIVPRGLVALPPYSNHLGLSRQEAMRAHIAWFYLSPKERNSYLTKAYPDLADDGSIQAALDMTFKYQPDGTPSLTPAERCALAILYKKKAMPNYEQLAYELAMTRDIVNPETDAR